MATGWNAQGPDTTDSEFGFEIPPASPNTKGIWTTCTNALVAGRNKADGYNLGGNNITYAGGPTFTPGQAQLKGNSSGGGPYYGVLPFYEDRGMGGCAIAYFPDTSGFLFGSYASTNTPHGVGIYCVNSTTMTMRFSVWSISFTGTIAADQLTISAFQAGGGGAFTAFPYTLDYPGVPAGLTVTSQISGTAGSTGVYQLSSAPGNQAAPILIGTGNPTEINHTFTGFTNLGTTYQCFAWGIRPGIDFSLVGLTSGGGAANIAETRARCISTTALLQTGANPTLAGFGLTDLAFLWAAIDPYVGWTSTQWNPVHTELTAWALRPNFNHAV